MIECPDGKLRPSVGACRMIASGSVLAGRDRSTISFRITFSTSELERVHEQRRDREPPLTEDRRHRGDDERHDRDTEVLHHDHRRLERVGQLVDRPEHVVLGRRNGAVADDDDAHHDHQERERPGRAPGAESSAVGHGGATVTRRPTRSERSTAGCRPRCVSYPSATTPCMTTEPSLPQGVLDKVRALLAKAESTTFDAEAEAFTAKAQELMARHRIDRAVFEARSTVSARRTRQSPVRASTTRTPTPRRCCSPASPTPTAARRCGARPRVHDRVRVRRRARRGRGAVHLAARAGHRRVAPGGIEVRRVRTAAAPPASGDRSSSPSPCGSGSDSARPSTPLSSRPSPKPGAHSCRSSPRAPAPPSAAAEAAFPDTRRFRPSVSDREGWHAGTQFADQADLSTDPALTRRTACQRAAPLSTENGSRNRRGRTRRLTSPGASAARARRSGRARRRASSRPSRGGRSG